MLRTSASLAEEDADAAVVAAKVVLATGAYPANPGLSNGLYEFKPGVVLRVQPGSDFSVTVCPEMSHSTAVSGDFGLPLQGFQTFRLIVVADGIEVAAASHGEVREDLMHSKPSPQNQIGKQIGKELKALYDVVLNEPIPDRFLTLVDRLGEQIMSTATDPRPAPELAVPQTLARASHATSGFPAASRSLPRGVKLLEPA